MKRLTLVACAALALAGCMPEGSASLPGAPAEVADQTVLDERGATAAELAYKAARLAGEMAVDAGLIEGDRARQVAALDNTAFAALGKVRAAYAAGNAASYDAALSEFNLTIADLVAVVSRKGA